MHVRCFGPFFNMIGQIETVFHDVTVNPFNNNFIIGVQGLRLETIGSSIIAPTLVFILICVLAGVFVYKMRHRYDFFLGGGLILQNVCI